MLNAVGASSNVCPSGAALATEALPMMPPPPVRFSTTTLCLKWLCSTSAASRPRMSVEPPGVKGTTIVTDPDGYCCASDAPDNDASSKVMPIDRAAIVMSLLPDFVSFSLPESGVGVYDRMPTSSRAREPQWTRLQY